VLLAAPRLVEPCSFRPRAIDGYFRYKTQPASKHCAALLRPLILCAMFWSAQWCALQSAPCPVRPTARLWSLRTEHRTQRYEQCRNKPASDRMQCHCICTSMRHAPAVDSVCAAAPLCLLAPPPSKARGRRQLNQISSNFPADYTSRCMSTVSDEEACLHPACCVFGVVRCSFVSAAVPVSAVRLEISSLAAARAGSFSSSGSSVRGSCTGSGLVNALLSLLCVA
jgi:hypothetical protein